MGAESIARKARPPGTQRTGSPWLRPTTLESLQHCWSTAGFSWFCVLPNAASPSPHVMIIIPSSWLQFWIKLFALISDCFPCSWNTGFWASYNHGLCYFLVWLLLILNLVLSPPSCLSLWFAWPCFYTKSQKVLVLWLVYVASGPLDLSCVQPILYFLHIWVYPWCTRLGASFLNTLEIILPGCPWGKRFILFPRIKY